VRLGVVTTGILQFEVEAGLGLLRELGVDAIEIGCAGYHPRKYGDPERLVDDPDELRRWRESLERHGLEVSALAIHGEPLSPDPEAAATYSRQFRAACRLAEAIGVERLTLLAGLPEACPGDSAPCWIVSPFPPRNLELHRWQWEERVLPYWREHAGIAEAHGCRLCFEMQPGDVVYNPETLLRLRAEIGPVVGCNFDPSHLFWQGIDPLEALRALADTIYHVHAKDTLVQGHVVRLNGVFDPKPYSRLTERAWVFRTVGYGHDESFWRDFVSTLGAVGYDDVVSIEHEDDFMDAGEGLAKACTLLRSVLIERPATLSWWQALGTDDA